MCVAVRSIQDLNTIFKELATLVIDQGTILDRIDYNMEQVVERVKAGVKELEEVRCARARVAVGVWVWRRSLLVCVCVRVCVCVFVCVCLCVCGGEGGTPDLTCARVQAEKIQKSSRPLKCIVFLLVLITIMVIILITRKTGSN